MSTRCITVCGAITLLYCFWRDSIDASHLGKCYRKYSGVLDDSSWTHYLQEVYGESGLEGSVNGSRDEASLSSFTKAIHKYDIAFHYRTTNVQIHPIDWTDLILVKEHHKKYRPYIGGYTTYRTHPDNSWVEVTRFARHYNEGLSCGFDRLCADNQTEVPYGCWFYQATGDSLSAHQCL